MHFGVALSAGHFDGPQVASLVDRVHTVRPGEHELRFTTHHLPGVIPVEIGRGLDLVVWGETVPWAKLPEGRFTWRLSLETGKWARPEVEVVRIPGDRVMLNGVWQPMPGGAMAGVLVRPTEGDGRPRVYVLVEPADRYHMIMFKCDWFPVPWSEVNVIREES